MAVGKVKWFNDEKGWGFIKQDSGPDVFVHYSQISGDGRRRLFEDEVVEFEIKEGPKGLQAINVIRLEGAAATDLSLLARTADFPASGPTGAGPAPTQHARRRGRVPRIGDRSRVRLAAAPRPRTRPRPRRDGVRRGGPPPRSGRTGTR